MSKIASAVREFVVENYLFGDDSAMPDDTASLVGAGVVDSTGILELIDFLETTFGITVADVEMLPENLDSVADIASFVSRKIGAA